MNEKKEKRLKKKEEKKLEKKIKEKLVINEEYVKERSKKQFDNK